MSNIENIKKAIKDLPEKDFVHLRQWFSEKDWKKWDKQIEKDSNSGKLEFLIKEAYDEKRGGMLEDI
jgi:hypothetical protein